MVAPFAEWRAGVAVAPPTGPSATTVVTSDDGGKTWQLSASKLTAPCREGYNGNNYGACEPSLLELNDGRVWMLLRTQAGFLYESFSRDGVTWPEARPSHFYSSNSPAFPVRLPDGRIVLFWNNCEMPPRTGQSLVYGGRDALHAALSADEGRTWRGYREVYRDPARNATPPRSGDRGTAYPHATVTADGRVLLVSGQGEDRRRRLLIDPDWLLEKEQEERFSDLDGWHVFKGFGPAAVRSWRDREPGARLIAHPDRASEKVLHVRRPEKREADGAVWNFPNGRRGRLTLRIRCQPGFAGAQIGLTDRMFEPCDDHGEKLAAVVLALDAAGSSAGARMVTPGRWQTLEFVWDVAAGHCKVTVDGAAARTLSFRQPAESGLNYLRLRSTASSTDAAGFLVESVRVTVE